MPSRSSAAQPRRAAHRLAVVCTPGLEAWCRAEMEALGLKPKPAGPGTFEGDATTRQTYACNLWLRTASRVVMRVATFRATDFGRLQAAVAALDWSPWLAEGTAPRFRISSNDSKLYHTDAIAQRLHKVVGPASEGEPEQMFVVRIERNTVTISADTSGAALHHRPWRTALSAAPLRTTMAAAALAAAGWRGETSLLDPFCGAGTIPIEAALLALGLPPGGRRPFAFHAWPSFEAGTWASVVAGIPAEPGPLPDGVTITGTDRDPAMVRAAAANAERAGVADHVTFAEGVVSQLKARPGPGLVLTNPPFGRRLGDQRLDGLYRRLGAVANQRLAGWDLALVSPERRLAHLADGRLAPLARFRHGGLPVELLHRAAPGEAEPANPARPESETLST
ncbi:MAG: class I SAM-dependent RNA methyltransferase [Acidimicrobiia bacterium]|nr:class I SAM-dependent RNA methyltransferase [Acidimicrobiia bacterium]MDH4365675.1 class I SAM-dependent RNA methyltransferase [Acidimicrobiia bacterium]MDH5288605.1 class I SAM-dependent RNA methyltransferase [Acidimicrobiia bacterium]